VVDFQYFNFITIAKSIHFTVNFNSKVIDKLIINVASIVIVSNFN